MKRLFFMAILAVAGTTAMAQTQQTKENKLLQTTTDKTAYVIDGKTASKDAFEKLQPDQIKDIVVLKGIEGAIVVNTKNADNGENNIVENNGENDIVEIKSYKLSESNGKVFKYWKVDDPEFDSTKVKKVITVSKDKNGNIKSEEKTRYVNTIIVRKMDNKSADVKTKPIIIVKNTKGEISVAGNMEEIKPENIKAISVVKDSKAEPYAKYGDIKYGVIVVELMK